jgi:hypothetical protein
MGNIFVDHVFTSSPGSHACNSARVQDSRAVQLSACCHATKATRCRNRALVVTRLVWFAELRRMLVHLQSKHCFPASIKKYCFPQRMKEKWIRCRSAVYSVYSSVSKILSCAFEVTSTSKAPGYSYFAKGIKRKRGVQFGRR